MGVDEDLFTCVFFITFLQINVQEILTWKTPSFPVLGWSFPLALVVCVPWYVSPDCCFSSKFYYYQYSLTYVYFHLFNYVVPLYDVIHVCMLWLSIVSFVCCLCLRVSFSFVFMSLSDLTDNDLFLLILS